MEEEKEIFPPTFKGSITLCHNETDCNSIKDDERFIMVLKKLFYYFF